MVMTLEGKVPGLWCPEDVMGLLPLDGDERRLGWILLLNFSQWAVAERAELYLTKEGRLRAVCKGGYIIEVSPLSGDALYWLEDNFAFVSPLRRSSVVPRRGKCPVCGKETDLTGAHVGNSHRFEVAHEGSMIQGRCGCTFRAEDWIERSR